MNKSIIRFLHGTIYFAPMFTEIHPDVIDLLRKQGIEDLYPPQKEAIPIALSGDDLVMAVPTAAGKSLVAYIAIINKLLKHGGKALYVVPLRALAREKYEELKEFKELGIKVGLSTGDLTESNPRLARYDVIVCTSEKADSLLRHNTGWLREVSILVVDEIHLLHDPSRGPSLEIVISCLRRLNPSIQILALSATIRNADEIADWLNAKLITSNWRPVELKEGVFYKGIVEFSDGSIKAIKEKNDAITDLVIDSISENGQVLVFVNTRKATISVAKKLSLTVKEFLSEKEKKSLENLSKKIVTADHEIIPLSEDLAGCVESGVAFHHAGLSSEQRRLIEERFKQGIIKCIVATPTLAAGVNIPARRVIIRDLWRYETGFGMQPIPVLEYKQQAGRAGRPKYDKIGEAIAIAKREEQKRRIMQDYILAEPEPIFSKLGTESALRVHILSIIASGFARDKESIVGFMSSTFYAQQSDTFLLMDSIKEVFQFLEKNGFIEIYDDRFTATLFGEKTSSLYIDPLSALQLRKALERAGYYGEIHSYSYLQAICSTPDMKSIYLRGGDEWIEDRLDNIRHKLLFDVPDVDDSEYEWFLSDFKTASLLEDWINEVSEAEISSKYGVGPGDIHAIIETAEWLLHAMRELARIYRFESVPELTDLIMRVKHGCKKELLNLVSLRNIGRVRARALYNAGFKTIGSLRGVPLEKLAKIPNIGKKVAMSIKKQIGDIP